MCVYTHAYTFIYIKTTPKKKSALEGQPKVSLKNRMSGAEQYYVDEKEKTPLLNAGHRSVPAWAALAHWVIDNFLPVLPSFLLREPKSVLFLPEQLAVFFLHICFSLDAKILRLVTKHSWPYRPCIILGGWRVHLCRAFLGNLLMIRKYLCSFIFQEALSFIHFYFY